MAKLNISGYTKIEGLQIGDWVCGVTSETNEIYTFLFDWTPDGITSVHQYMFNLITIYRDYQNPNGFKLEVDFNIVRSDGYVDQFPKVKEHWMYAHNLITLDKFKEVLKPLLVLTT
jgi:hypothetical protein